MFDNAICGDSTGGLHLFRFSALQIEKLKANNWAYDRVTKKEMAATRSFNAHTSAILSIEIFKDNTIITTSLAD